ncbi:MAG TPA: hypothetical protein VE990_07295 [Acidimicrobiales bacterium]|nr:hypothetical protein [Acidimicrobiales bacterium]
MIDRLLRLLRTVGWARGVRRGQPVWLVLGLAAWLYGRARSKRGPQPVYTEDLSPGESVVISHQAPPA